MIHKQKKMASYLSDAFERLRNKPNQDITFAMRSFQACYQEAEFQEQRDDQVEFDIEYEKEQCDEDLLNVLRRTNLDNCTVYCPEHKPKRDAI